MASASVLPPSSMARLQATTFASSNSKHGLSGLNTCASLVALLREDDAQLKVHALRKLYAIIDNSWAEASEAVTTIESLAEDEAFAAHDLAAAVASKIYYHLEEYDEAVRLALTAGQHFDVSAKGEYVDTIVAHCIDQYTALRARNAAAIAVAAAASEGSAGAGGAPPATLLPIDPRLEAVVDRMFERCLREGAWKAALGVALEARRLDVISQALMGSAAATTGGAATDSTGSGGTAAAASVLSHAFDLVTGSAAISSAPGSKRFRSDVLRCLAERHAAMPVRLPRLQHAGEAAASSGGGSRDCLAYARVLLALDDAAGMAALLLSLAQIATEERGEETGAGWATNGGAAVDSGVVRASDYALLAFQIAFDVAEAENAQFAVRVLTELPPAPRFDVTAAPAPPPAAAPAAASAGTAAAAPSPVAAAAADGDASVSATEDEPLLGAAAASSDTTAPPAAAAAANPSAATAPVASSSFPLTGLLSRVRCVLDGTVPSAVALHVLSSAAHTDGNLLKAMKAGSDPRNSVLHHATLVAHGYMTAGTANDAFLRGNLDWLGRAANWAKFSATASQGVIHRGATPAGAMEALRAYLPVEGAPTGSAFSEGGALLALGLSACGASATTANGGGGGTASGAGAPDIVAYLSNALKNTQNEVLQHGACLGLGVAAMGSASDPLYASLRDILFQDSATAGEAAGLGIGLLLCGRGPAWTSDITGESVSSEMLTYAHATQHEKAIRGIALGLALQCAGCEDAAGPLIESMMRDTDALLRYGGTYATALAFAGTGSNAAVRRLLHTAVSDVSDDVRRAAVTGLGFVLCRAPGEVPGLVAQLAESYNPHVRYGAAMALGVACAGGGGAAAAAAVGSGGGGASSLHAPSAAAAAATAVPSTSTTATTAAATVTTGAPAPATSGGPSSFVLGEAVRILEPMLSDSTDFVRQGALLALGLVLQQEAAGHLPAVTAIRERMLAMTSDRHQSTLTRMGALLGLGVLDVAGGNGAVSLVSRSGQVKLGAVAGIAVWLQYWYWFPLLHFLSLGVSPTVLVGLTGDFEMPVEAPGGSGFSPSIECPPSWHAYPEPLAEKKAEKSGPVTTVTLSVASAKAKAAKAKAAGAGAAAASGAATISPSSAAAAAAASVAETSLEAGSAGAAGAGPVCAAGGTASGAMDVESPLAHPPAISSSSGASAGSEMLPSADAMSVDAVIATTGGGGSGATTTAAAAASSDGKEGTAAAVAKPKEPASYRVSNLVRVTHGQAKFLSFPPGQRFVPMRRIVSAASSSSSPLLSAGIVMLRDMSQQQHATAAPAAVVAAPSDAAAGATAAAAAPAPLTLQRVALPTVRDGSAPEPAPPAPFVWIPGEYM